MLISIYILLFCVLGIVGILAFRYFINRKNILVCEGVVESRGTLERNNKLEDTKNLIFAFFDKINVVYERQGKMVFHNFLHFFVILLGYVSDGFDFLYTKARDMFLRTATKEREVVAKFWPHLKEYKREKEDENKF